LYCDVVLGAEAIQAQRLALLVELTAERLGRAHLGGRSGWCAAFHLELAAHLARQVSEREPARCAAKTRRADQTRHAESVS
jgi:hypothetical protein